MKGTAQMKNRLFGATGLLLVAGMGLTACDGVTVGASYGYGWDYYPYRDSIYDNDIDIDINPPDRPGKPDRPVRPTPLPAPAPGVRPPSVKPPSVSRPSRPSGGGGGRGGGRGR